MPPESSIFGWGDVIGRMAIGGLFATSTLETTSRLLALALVLGPPIVKIVQDSLKQGKTIARLLSQIREMQEEIRVKDEKLIAMRRPVMLQRVSKPGPDTETAEYTVVKP